MRVTRISVRRKKLNALFFDGDERFDGQYSEDGGLLIDRDICEKSGVSEGDDMDEEEIERLIFSSQCARAYSRGLWLLDSRDYTRKAMYGKLRPLFGADAANSAADRLVQAGIIDDERFAQRNAELLLSSAVSERETVEKLVQKGVDRQIARQTVSLTAKELDCSPEAQLKEIIDKKYAARLGRGDKDEVRRVFAALARKGFDFDDIRTAISEFCDSGQEDQF